MSLYLRIVLAEDHVTLGSAGEEVLVFMENVLGMKEEGSGSLLILQQPAGITSVKVTQPFSSWNSVVLNPR